MARRVGVIFYKEGPAGHRMVTDGHKMVTDLITLLGNTLARGWRRRGFEDGMKL